MTNNEAFQSVLSSISYDVNVAAKAMIDNNIIGTDTYSKDNAKSIDVAALAVLESLLSQPDVSEGNLSIKYDRSAILKRIDLINSRLAVASTSVPKIVNKTNLW